MIAKDEGLSNFLPINRKFFNHVLWNEERTYSKAEAWLDLLQRARFEASEGKMLMGGKMVTYGRGQQVASLRFLSTRWQWSTKKVTGFIDLLTDERMITKVTQKETGQSIITICNYDSYNKNETAKKQRGNTEETGRKQEGNKTNIVNKEEECFLAHTPEERGSFAAFEKWVSEKAKNVSKFKEPFTIAEYLKLKDKFSSKEISGLVIKMHNYKPLLDKNVSAYLTFLNWAKREYPETQQLQPIGSNQQQVTNTPTLN